MDRIKHPADEITIHVVGKYVGYEDSYKSLNEALTHGGFPHGLKVNIKWVEAEALEEPDGARLLDGADGILVPGGFGDRGTRGMMKAAEVARERRDPVLRHLLRLPVGHGRVRAQRVRPRRRRLDRVQRGHAAQGHLQAARPARRGRPGRHDAARAVRLRADAGLAGAAGLRRDLIHERHRHRYEFNPPTSRRSTEHGLQISGKSPDGKFVEIVELPGHPWFVAVQFHPEFKSKPLRPHPLFAGFVGASHRHKLQRLQARAEAGRRSCSRPRLRPAASGRTGSRPQPTGSSVGSASSPRLYNVRVNSVEIGSFAVGGGRPLVLIAGPCVIESDGARGRTGGGAIRDIARAPGVPVRLQGVVRQGQPDVHRLLPGPGPRRGPAHPRRGQGATSACRS